MLNIRKKNVVFCSIFLSILYFTNIFSAQYEVGTNTITRDIYFRLVVQDSLDVELEAENAHLDFGEILKDSTETKQARTAIKVKASKNVNYVSATYKEGEDQSDNTKKIQIKYQEENLGDTKRYSTKETVSATDEVDTIDVYFKPFDKSYKLEAGIDQNEGEIPVIGEIRGIGKAKLGKYEGKMQVEVLVVTNNVEEEEIKWQKN